MANRIYSNGWSDYELIDAGGGKKLERWGSVITIRPEVQAYFHSGMPFADWQKMAHWEFIPSKGQSGRWKALKPNAPAKWTISYGRLKFQLETTKFKHLGLFPEQQTNWEFLDTHLAVESKFLNLFAYTGAASCVARLKGAETFHVDSVKQLISWAKENMEASKLLNIKWVHEDALKFVQREVKRERNYNAIMMDPPAWGIGAKGEQWKLEEQLDGLLSSAVQLLDPNGVLVMNTYSPTVDIPFLQELVDLYCADFNAELSELWMKTTTQKEVYYGNLVRLSKGGEEN
jgi:23S rRNA (cytosine1962-C5)-methyltransferase